MAGIRVDWQGRLPGCWLLPHTCAFFPPRHPLVGSAGSAVHRSDTGTDGGGGGSQQAAMAAAQCEGALNFLAAMLGLLLPFLFLVKTQDAASLAWLQARQVRTCGSSVFDQLAAAWHRMEAGAEQALRSLVGRSWLATWPPFPEPLLGGCERWVAWVLLLAMTWVWCAAPALVSAAASA